MCTETTKSPEQLFAECREQRNRGVLSAEEYDKMIATARRAYMEKHSHFYASLHRRHRQSEPMYWCIINDGVICKTEEYSDLSTTEWIKKQFDFENDTAEAVIRGSVSSERIVICRGSNYAPIDMNQMPEGALKFLVHWYCDKYATLVAHVVNGLRVGKVGELWPAVEDLGLFSCCEIHRV